MEKHEYVVKGSKEILVTIEIPLEEYKELLMIKGRYEELKSQIYKHQPSITPTIYRDIKITDPLPEQTYKITCHE